MINRTNFGNLVLSFTLAVAFLFSGCSSTDSDEDNNGSSIATFSSGTIAPDETFSYTFDEEGTVDYYCEIHAPNMQGSVTVNSSVESAERDTVIMENDQFHPSSLSIAPDTEVVWVNNEDHNHNIKNGNPSSDGGNGGGY